VSRIVWLHLGNSSPSAQLAGLSVIRAFGQQSNFEKDLQRAVNDELVSDLKLVVG
jgi:hypothetical protein